MTWRIGDEIQLPLTVFVLLEDGDQTMHSSPSSIGFAVMNEREAQLWAESSRSRSYARVRVEGHIQAVLEERQREADERDEKFRRMIDLDEVIQRQKHEEAMIASVEMMDGRPLPVRSPEELDALFAEIPARQKPLEFPDLADEEKKFGVAIEAR